MAELSAQGPIISGAATSVAVATSASPFSKGLTMKDAAGNVYMWVEFTEAVFSGVPVQINSDFTASRLATTGRGAVGVAQGAATSDENGWVMVYGRTQVQLGMSGVSPSDAANGPTTLQTSLQTVFVLGTSLTSPNGVGWVSGAAAALTTAVTYVIEGMFVATDASPGDVSAVTSATSHTGNQIAVFLNFPYIRNQEATS
jgi:hypothetical protein